MDKFQSFTKSNFTKYDYFKNVIFKISVVNLNILKFVPYFIPRSNL